MGATHVLQRGSERRWGATRVAASVVLLHVAVLGPLAGFGVYLTSGDGRPLLSSPGVSTPRAAAEENIFAKPLPADDDGAAWRRSLAGGSSGSSSGSGGSGSGSGSYSASGSGGGHHGIGGAAPILSAFGTLFCGAMLLWLFSKCGVPYTVILLAVGMAAGAALIYAEEAIGDTGDDLRVLSLRVWAKLDAHLMLNIFLPPLIFESAFATEFAVFYQCMYYCLFLAVPCMLAATYATGSLANWLLMPRDADGEYLALPHSMNGASNATLATGVCAPNAWSEEAGYTLGVVLSATDPVAVVALLKELGLAGLLPVGIEGESLLNDGTALVLFQILLSTIKDAASFCGSDAFPCPDGQPNPGGYVPSDHWLDPSEVIIKFAGGALIGICSGLIMGLILTTWMSTVYNDAMVEVSLTLAFAYLTFYISENLLGSSGVLAVVALGLWMSRNGRTQISTTVEEFLTEFWEMLAYFGNTLIFVITGIIFVYDLYHSGEAPVSLDDLPHLLLIYVGCLLIRWALVTLAYAVFNCTGLLPMPWKWSLIST